VRKKRCREEEEVMCSKRRGSVLWLARAGGKAREGGSQK